MSVRVVVFVVVASVALAAGTPMRAQEPAPQPAPPPAAIETVPLPKQGKQVLNASGIAPLADSRFLIVDNRTTDALFELTVGPDGQAKGDLVRRPLVVNGGYKLEDMENVTLAETPSGRYLFISTSLSVKASKKSSGAPAVRPGGLVRIALTDSGPLTADVIPNFRDWLFDKFVKDKAIKALEPDKGGLNVEGLAWDQVRGALLVGVRSPVGNGVAFVAPVRVKDLADEWKDSHLEALPMLTVPTGASEAPLGIRGIEYDPRRKGFLVLLGNAFSGADVPFQLCLWDGQDKSPLRKFEGLRFAPNSKPEGVTTGTVDGKPVIVIADDAGGFRVISDDDARLK